MAQIPPAAWIGVGTAVTIASMLMQELLLFVIPGVVFILYGAAMLLRTNTDSDAPAPEHTYNTKPQERATNDYTRCYVCSAKNSPQANYCGHCGHKLP